MPEWQCPECGRLVDTDPCVISITCWKCIEAAGPNTTELVAPVMVRTAASTRTEKP